MADSKARIIELKNYLETKIIGQEELVRKLIITLLADGHALVEGAPGLAKTKAIKTLAECITSRYNRIQFTPDLLPTDITGSEIYVAAKGEVEFRKGPIFANLILADEINRAPAKVQSALLEAMAERQVSVGGKKYLLPELFMVMATQNPIEHEGTYNLPEAQLDRFLIRASMGYPDHKSSVNILRDRHVDNPLDRAYAVVNKEELLGLVQDVRKVDMRDAVLDYVTTLVEKTRTHPQAALGVSPRGALAVCRMAKAYAYLNGRDFVMPEDVAAIFPDVCAHRLMLNSKARMMEEKPESVLAEILKTTDMPVLKK